MKVVAEKNAAMLYNIMSSVSSLYKVNLNLSKDYKECVDDIIKIAVIMLFYNISGNVMTGASYLISEASLEAIMLVILGVCFYYLIFKQTVAISYSDAPQ